MALDPRFQYETYERNIFATREELTAMSKILLDAKASWISIIWNTIRIVGLLALFKIRQQMMSEEQMLGRQIYMRRRAGDVGDDLDDNLDGVKKP